MARRQQPDAPRRRFSSMAGASGPMFSVFGGRLAGLVGLALLHAGAPGVAACQPTSLAIADFDYIDTSGEPQDQADKHQALMQAFVNELRRDLGEAPKYRIAPLACEPAPCTAARVGPALIEAARRAGAALLVYGGVHKLSTLVQTAKVQVIDIGKDQIVLDRNLTFRGDDDRAWRRAESFIAADLKAQDFSR